MADLIMDSVRYLIHCRCRLPEPNRIEFATITHLDTLPLVARLGYQVNVIARSLLNDIARYIKIMENERSTFYEQEGTPKPNLSRDRRSAVSRPANSGPEADQQPLGKYGRMALNQLRNHHPQRFLILQMQGDLMEKIHQVEQEALERLEQLSEQLLRLHPMPQTEDTLVRTRHLNQIKSTAEELVLNEIVLRPR